jgi:spore coat polysaccharide biosynthesis predicted glycosyltransferase SpsG
MRLKDLIACLFDGHGIPRKVFFRVDAGRIKGLSFGHLARCHVLSKALKKYGNTETIFFMQNYVDGVKYAKTLGEKVIIIKEGHLNWIKGLACTIIFDLPNVPGTDELAIAKRKGLWTIVLDDTNSNVPWANVVLNSSILSQSATYPKEARLLVGPEYFILDESFETANRNTGRQNDLFSVLITFGGSDPAGLTLKVLKALKALKTKEYQGVLFKVILGPGFGDKGPLDSFVDCFPGKIELISNPNDLLPFFIDSDLAICAGGRTLYELNALKIPTIAISSIEHEMITIKAFKEKGMILGGLNKWDEYDFLKLFEYAEAQVKSCYLRYAGD